MKPVEPLVLPFYIWNRGDPSLLRASPIGGAKKGPATRLSGCQQPPPSCQQPSTRTPVIAKRTHPATPRTV